jgi:hypothetical protein
VQGFDITIHIGPENIENIEKKATTRARAL